MTPRLEKAATSTTSDLKILQGIIPVEDMRELFGYKTLDSKETHSSLFEKSYKNVLSVDTPFCNPYLTLHGG